MGPGDWTGDLDLGQGHQTWWLLPGHDVLPFYDISCMFMLVRYFIAFGREFDVHSRWKPDREAEERREEKGRGAEEEEETKTEP